MPRRNSPRLTIVPKMDEGEIVAKVAAALKEAARAGKVTSEDLARIAVATMFAGGAGETPLEYMIRVMRDPRTDDKRRDAMAMKAAALCHKSADDGDNEPLKIVIRKFSQADQAPAGNP